MELWTQAPLRSAHFRLRILAVSIQLKSHKQGPLFMTFQGDWPTALQFG